MWLITWQAVGTTVMLFGICLSHLGLCFSLDWLHFQTTSLHVVANISTSKSRLTTFSPNISKSGRVGFPWSWPDYCGSVDSIHWLNRHGSHIHFWGQLNIGQNMWIEEEKVGILPDKNEVMRTWGGSTYAGQVNISMFSQMSYR